MPSRHFLQKLIFSRSPSVFLLRKNPPPSRREARSSRKFNTNQNLRTNLNSLPLEGKVRFAEQNSDAVESQITHNLEELYNDCFAIYTSPPPTAEPLLKEKPFGGRSI